MLNTYFKTVINDIMLIILDINLGLLITAAIYTVSQKKMGHFYFYCNYGKCWSIFKIFYCWNHREIADNKNEKYFPPHLNFVAALPCKTNTSMNACVKLWRFCIEKHKT